MNAGNGHGFLASESSVLNVEGLSKQFYIYERERRIVAFESINFVASTRQFVCLVGASGSGKSSILKCIYRTYLPTAGSIDYKSRDGSWTDLAHASNSEMLALRRSEIRFVSQFLSAVPRRTSLQIIERAAQDNKQANSLPEDIAKSCLQKVGLPESLWHLPPNTFSGGEKQLVNLAQALAVKPRLLLLDEPTASLDPASTDQMLHVFEQLKTEDMAIVAVFHDRSIIRRLADHAIELEGGLTTTTFAKEVP